MDDLFDTNRAAEYCGLKLSAFKYYVYRKQAIRGELKGGVLIFRKSALDDFMKKRTDGRGRGKST
jgi:hypothetical protein